MFSEVRIASRRDISTPESKAWGRLVILPMGPTVTTLLLVVVGFVLIPVMVVVLVVPFVHARYTAHRVSKGKFTTTPASQI